MADGPEVGTAYVSIVPSAAKFGSTLQSQITGQAATAGVSAGQALGTGVTSGAKGMVAGIAGLLASAGTFRFLQGAVGEAEDAIRVGKLTEAVIRSTGGVANVSAAQVENLAESLSKVVGVDDELIAAGENVLLTFTKVRNEAGAGNDVFNQATRAALDMSAALGGDLQGSIVQLGKALQDPIQGLTALRRSGVSFTDAQTEMIKGLQESGDLLGAQKIILAELGTQFGGAAAANATDLDKLAVAVGNFKELIGGGLLPIIGPVTSALTGLLETFQGMPGPVKATTTVLFLVGGAATVAALGVGLLAPKVRAARLELASMGGAGAKASSAVGLLGKSLTGMFVVGAVVTLMESFTQSVDDNAEAIARLSGATDEDLLNKFSASKLGAYARGDDPKVLQSQLDLFQKASETSLGTGQRIIDVLRAAGQETGAYEQVLREVTAAQKQANKDQAAGAKVLGDVAGGAEVAGAELDKMATAIFGTVNAERARDEAVRAVIASEADLAESQRELNQLIAAGAVDAERVAEARRSLAEATRSAAAADRDLAEAQAAYDEAVVGLGVLHGFDTAQDAVADAAGNLADAQDSSASAHERAAEAAEDLRTAQAGDPEFQDRLADAHARVTDALEGVADANFDLAQRAYDLDEATKLSNASLTTNAGLVTTLRSEWETLLSRSPEIEAFLAGPLSLLGPRPTAAPGSNLQPLVGAAQPAPGTWALADAQTNQAPPVTINVTQTDPDPQVLAHEISWALIP